MSACRRRIRSAPRLPGGSASAESQVTVIAPDMGGGFGQKVALLREELIVAAVARHLDATVRWREERGENLIAALHAREETVRTQAAVDADGRLLALKAQLLADFGAYCFFPANYMARVVALILPGPYRLSDYAYELDVVLTNKCPAGPMRAPMAITSWVIEGTMDAIARALSLDPLAVRRLNMLEPGDFPYVTATGETYRDITPAQSQAAAADLIGYADFRRTQATARAAGRLVGLGICNVVESTTYGSQFYKSAGIPGSGHETAWVRIEPSGAVNVAVGLMGSGQGYETTLAQCVAAGLGVEPDAVRVLLGHTDIAPYGMGSRGSRGAAAGGGAAYLAARRAAEKVLAIAAHQLALNAATGLRIAAGRIERLIGATWEPTGLALKDIARLAYLDPMKLPDGMEPGIDVQYAYDPPPMTYSNATHICTVEIERETGRPTILRYVVVGDSGTPINPMIVDGQMHGAVAMGLGGALQEAVVYDSAGQILTGSLMDFAAALATDLPAIEVQPPQYAEPPDPARHQGHVGRRHHGGDRGGRQRGERCARAARDRDRCAAAHRGAHLEESEPAALSSACRRRPSAVRVLRQRRRHWKSLSASSNERRTCHGQTDDHQGADADPRCQVQGPGAELAPAGRCGPAAVSPPDLQYHRERRHRGRHHEGADHRRRRLPHVDHQGRAEEGDRPARPQDRRGVHAAHRHLVGAVGRPGRKRARRSVSGT